MQTRFRAFARALVFLGFVSVFAGCGPSKPTLHPVAQLAPFDLNCPQEQIRYFNLNEKTYGARGCGRQARYVKLCRTTNPYGGKECQWVAN